MSEYSSAGQGAGPVGRADAGVDRPAGPVSDRLQALLSRAVEDQLSEQRQVATTLSEVRSLLGELRAEIRSAGAATGIEVVAATLGRLGEEVRADVAEQAGGIDAVRGELAGLLQEVRGLAGRGGDYGSLGGMPERVEQIYRRLDAVADATDVRAVTERIVGLSDRVTALDERVYAVADKLGGLDALFDELAAIRVRLSSPGPLSSYGSVESEALAGLRAEVTELARRLAPAPPSTLDPMHDEQLLDTVRTTVQRPIAEAEERLREHIDDAVFALADALLRPRGDIPAATADTSSVARSQTQPPADDFDDAFTTDDVTTDDALTAYDALAAPHWLADEEEAGADDHSEASPAIEPSGPEPVSVAPRAPWRSWTHSAETDHEPAQEADEDRDTDAVATPTERSDPAAPTVNNPPPEDTATDESRCRRGWWSH